MFATADGSGEVKSDLRTRMKATCNAVLSASRELPAYAALCPDVVLTTLGEVCRAVCEPKDVTPALARRVIDVVRSVSSMGHYGGVSVAYSREVVCTAHAGKVSGNMAAGIVVAASLVGIRDWRAAHPLAHNVPVNLFVYGFLCYTVPACPYQGLTPSVPREAQTCAVLSLVACRRSKECAQAPLSPRTPRPPRVRGLRGVKGVGSWLISSFILGARDVGVKTLVLEVTVPGCVAGAPYGNLRRNSLRLASLYDRLGFREWPPARAWGIFNELWAFPTMVCDTGAVARDAWVRLLQTRAPVEADGLPIWVALWRAAQRASCASESSLSPDEDTSANHAEFVPVIVMARTPCHSPRPQTPPPTHLPRTPPPITLPHTPPPITLPHTPPPITLPHTPPPAVLPRTPPPSALACSSFPRRSTRLSRPAAPVAPPARLILPHHQKRRKRRP